MTDAGNGFIPSEILKGTKDYAKRIAGQANGCHKEGWYDACAAMLRRLIEILIIDTFEAKGALGDIMEYGWNVPAHQLSKPATGVEIRKFVKRDFKELDDALQAVAVSELDVSPLVDRSATGIWQSLRERVPEIPDEILHAFDEVIATRHSATSIHPPTTTGRDLASAQKAIRQILGFLSQKFPSADVQPPSEGQIVPLASLIDRYLGAPKTHWHVERLAGAALRKMKKLGDMGAHGRYHNVTKQDLDTYRAEFSNSIGQLANTAQVRAD